jgi:acetyl esterase/lipase
VDEDHSISSKPNLLALFYPCSDVTTDDEKMYGGDAIGEYGKEVSPLYHVHQKLPPMLIIQGTDDIVYEENKKFCTESTAVGNACEFIVYKGAPHGFLGRGVENGKWYKQTLNKMDGFLTNAGYLQHK